MKKIIIFILGLLIIIPFILFTNIEKVDGKFYCEFEATDTENEKNTYYQFKSNDNSVWWVLTEEEIGFIPDSNTEYILTFNNKGTTKDNKKCDCPTDWICDCDVYDDVFISIKEKE